MLRNRLADRSVTVSVPSSSGNSLQPTAKAHKRIAASRFSPLFIGELSSTFYPSAPPPDESEFQSPLHRGTLFNAGVRMLTRCFPAVSVPSSSGNSLQLTWSVSIPANLPVSVPSSSGNSLQPAGSTAPANCIAGFSPLFIGELSSTSRPTTRNTGSSSFQSPLHRGTLFNGNQLGQPW